MTYLAHAPEGIVIASLIGLLFLARRERATKKKLIEQHAAMRLALRDASHELYLASAELSHSRRRYAAKFASEAADAARKAAADK